jgi:hypothetical protein
METKNLRFIELPSYLGSPQWERVYSIHLHVTKYSFYLQELWTYRGTRQAGDKPIAGGTTDLYPMVEELYTCL